MHVLPSNLSAIAESLVFHVRKLTFCCARIMGLMPSHGGGIQYNRCHAASFSARPTTCKKTSDLTLMSRTTAINHSVISIFNRALLPVFSVASISRLSPECIDVRILVLWKTDGGVLQSSAELVHAAKTSQTKPASADCRTAICILDLPSVAVYADAS